MDDPTLHARDLDGEGPDPDDGAASTAADVPATNDVGAEGSDPDRPSDRAPSDGQRRFVVDRPVTWVALTGFMGTGKSRIGWELSRSLALTFIDTDRVIERVSCMRITDIFEVYGEEVFREYETEIVRRCLNLDDVVVSTGGGTVVRDVNRQLLKSRGPVVGLHASPETIYKRTRRHKRPLLEVGDPTERIRRLLAEREDAYRDAATFRVSTDERDSSDVVAEIEEKLTAWRAEHPDD